MFSGPVASTAIVFLAGGLLAGTSKLQPPSGIPIEAAFGSAVALRDGLAAIGAPRELDSTGRQAGAVYIRKLDGSQSWRLTPSDAATRFQFGKTLAMDGEVLVVGANLAAYVFRLTGGVWAEEAKFEQSSCEGRFGEAVAVDGDRMAVGAPLLACVQESLKGHVFLYRRVSGVWQLDRKLGGGSTTVGDYYGRSVALDGDLLAVGAPYSSKVHVYRHDGAKWLEESGLVQPPSNFGWDLVYRDGRLVVGAPGDATLQQGSGAAFVYRRSGASWVFEAKLLPPPTSPPQALTGSYYGLTVGISGLKMAMAGPQADVDKEQNGSVLVYELENGSWVYRTRWLAPDGGSFDYLGQSLDMDAGAVLAGAPGHDGMGSNTGAAYLFGGSAGGGGNQSPKALFTVATSGLTVTVDATTASDPDGTIEAYDWTFGDGASASGVVASHTYAGAGTYTVKLFVTDNLGAKGSQSKSVTVTAPDTSTIKVTATGYKVRNLQKVDLAWTGATSATVDIFFTAAGTTQKIATPPNTGAYTHDVDRQRGGTYKYEICEAGTSVCSNEVSVTFY